MSSPSKYHEDDRVQIGAERIKRTSVCYGAVEKETPHGFAIIMHNAVYAKKGNGQLERIDRKPKLGKAGKKEYKRIVREERKALVVEKTCKL